jgi:hypothetical protein
MLGAALDTADSIERMRVIEANAAALYFPAWRDVRIRFREAHQRNRRWAREHPGQRDEAWFKREIVPKLDAFTLREIGKATGLSLAACSRIRAGARVPHPRHWDGLLALVEAGN